MYAQRNDLIGEKTQVMHVKRLDLYTWKHMIYIGGKLPHSYLWKGKNSTYIREKRPTYILSEQTYFWKTTNVFLSHMTRDLFVKKIIFFSPVRERRPYLSRNNRFMFVGLLGTRYQTFWICGVLCCLYVCCVCLRL